MNLVKLQQHAYRSVFLTPLPLSHVRMLYLHGASIFFEYIDMNNTRNLHFDFVIDIRHICFQTHIVGNYSFRTLV